jgi:hypothetical protein
MADSQYDQFLQEATAPDAASGSGIGRDCLYGVYTSWCFLSRSVPRTEDVFWAAMKKKKIRPGRTPLRIKGPAAADYILSTYPGLVGAP